MKMKIFSGIAVLAFSFLMAGCMEGDKFDHNKAVIVMTGAEVNPVLRFVVETAPASYVVSATATKKVTERTVVTFAIDPSLVEAYNKEYKSTYFPIPAGAVELDETEGVFEPGQAISTGVMVRVVSTDELEEGRIYMIPVTITSVQGGSFSVLKASKTAYLRISRTTTFNSLDLNYSTAGTGGNGAYTTSTTAPYAQVDFPEEKRIDLNNGFTFEIRCYLDQWHPSTSAGNQISRMCTFQVGTGNLLRFGEDGMAINQLQWVGPGGNLISKKEFQTQQWYLISLVYDGFSSFAMYVDGMKDVETSAVPNDITFSRIELGCSGSGNRISQRFLGKICEIRVWDRALSTNELQMGLCSVDPQSPGLRAYWKFDEGAGHIFHDATGNGYDLDWSRARRNDTGTTIDVDLKHVVKWFNDATVNKCNP